jgi:hypothetical protein
MRKPPKPFLIAVCALILLGGFAGTPASGARAQEPIPAGVRDLAALSLRPNDVPEAGWRHEGAFYEDIGSAAEITAGYLGESAEPEDVESDLRAFGWVRMYVGLLAQPTVNGSPPPLRIRTAITEFETEAGAAAGFAYLEDESAVPSATDVSTARTFGEQSELTDDRGTSAVDGRSFRSLDLSYRLGRVMVSVALVAYGAGATPDQVLVETVAEVIEGRLRTPPPAGLGAAVARFEIGEHDILTYDDAYYRFSGDDILIFDEADEAAALRVASYEGATDVYQLSQGVDVGAPHGVLYGVTALQFETEATAAAWLAALPESLAENPFYGSPVPVQVDDNEADEAVVISYISGGASGAQRAMLVAIRAGDAVVRVHLVPQGLRGNVPLDPVLALAQIGAGCLGGSLCAPLTSLPDSLAA